MSKPKISHMIAYLQRIGVKLTSLDPLRVEAEYFRKIYKVQPRQQVLDNHAQPLGRHRKSSRHRVLTTE